MGVEWTCSGIIIRLSHTEPAFFNAAVALTLHNGLCKDVCAVSRQSPGSAGRLKKKQKTNFYNLRRRRNRRLMNAQSDKHSLAFICRFPIQTSARRNEDENIFFLAPRPIFSFKLLSELTALLSPPYERHPSACPL